MALVSLEEARIVAMRFLSDTRYDCENPDPNGPKITAEHHEYVLNEKAVAYEFPLFKDGVESGYVIVSGDKREHPILEYVTTGSHLRSQLEACLRGFFARLNIESVAHRWHYFGPLDLVVEVQKPDARYLYARIPNLQFFESDKLVDFKYRKPAVSKFIEDRWKFYEGVGSPRANLPCSKMFGIGVSLYNQTCAGSLNAESPRQSQNYCTPQCIAGCVATAWVMLASAYESFMVTGKIFSDSPDWKSHWQSSYGNPPPPGSVGVNRHMWNVHAYMGTTCAGSTSDSNALAGSRLFSDFDLPWRFGYNDSIDYAFVAKGNKFGQPVLLTAQSQWVPGEVDGHGVVVHGYNDNDAHIYISRGWGAAFPDIWIAYSSLTQATLYFVASWTLSESGNSNNPCELLGAFRPH